MDEDDDRDDDRLKIKLKVSPKSLGDGRRKTIGEETEEEVRNRRNEIVDGEDESIELARVEEKQQEARVCDFCGKTFGSGKALGGHRRIHLIQAGDRKIHKPIKVRIDGDETSDRDLRRRTCCICEKSFPSEKSLFGHMRFHPERGWRGVKPPGAVVAAANTAVCNKHSSSSSTISDDEESPPPTLDLIGSLSGWARTNRRGKKSTYHDSSDHEDSNHQTDSNDCTVPDDAAAHSLLHLSRGKTATIQYDHDSYGEDSHIRSPKNAKIECGRDHDSSGEALPRSFRCGTCDRSFKALGGHKSSHAKNGGGEATSSDNRQQCGDNNNVLEYKCKICDRSFSSGQALGGHQRSHWVGPAEKETTSFSVGSGRSGLEIDLNQLPEAEEEEE